MAHTATRSVFRQIESLFEGGSVAGLTDRQLLERFSARRDPAGEAAFAALVTRHGPMVLDICHSIMGDLHHAEDAFQAVFLVLARRAQSIRDPDLLGNWLYGVAIRTARCAKLQIDRQRKNEEQGAMSRLGSGSSTGVESMAREDMEALHDEIARLPGPFRLPVVLCYFEGLTLDEAARKLRWPAGTLRSRLARARDKLRIGLTRRGVVLPATVLATALGTRSASASVSSSLCDITTKAAIQFAAGRAASSLAASLAQEVLKAMFVNKLRLIATTLLLLAAVATGAGSLTHSWASQDEPKRPQVADRPDDISPHPGPARMFVVGRVLDPQGKPVPNAMTMVYAAIKQPGSRGLLEKMRPSAIGQARSDGSGRFQVDASRTTSARHHQFGAVASAPGYGAGWVELDPGADRPGADITLRPEQVIQGRLFDLNGRPVQGVTVSVGAMRRILQRHPNIPRERLEGPILSWSHVNDLPAWPKPGVSDADGRFTLRGVGRDLRVDLIVVDPQFARQRIPVDTDGTSESKPLTLALEPAKVIRGRITEADTGKPIPHAQLMVLCRAGNRISPNGFEADAEGRFRANPLSGDSYTVSVAAPEGAPYLAVSKSFTWPKGALEYPIDLALPRGVAIHGKVTEEGSGKPVAGAKISFRGPQSKRGVFEFFRESATSGSDGSFQIGVLPSSGYLVVLGPSDNYVLREITTRMVSQGKPGGRPAYAHAFIACDVKPDSDSLEVNVVLRPGMTVTGQVIGPDGQPIQDAWMFSPVCLTPSREAWLEWTIEQICSAKSGRFEVHGLDPEAEVPVYFLDPHHKLGTTVHFSGKSAAGGPVTVRLQPCGNAKERLVDASGKPIAGYRSSDVINMVVAPSNSLFRDEEAAPLARIDPINYGLSSVSDAQGRIAFPALVPGATYRIYDYSTKANPGSSRIRKEFTVKPGETLDLGDLVISKRKS